MKPLFVDTAGWVACADAGDSTHARCCAVRDQALAEGRRLVTTDYVIDETLTLLKLSLGNKAAERWWDLVAGSSRLRWERIDSDRFEAARRLLFQYGDHDFSFTDCTSFAVMRELRLSDVLTLDRHFDHLGFRRLPTVAGARRRRRPS